MKLKINGEFLKRHLFVTVLMAGLGCWFGYDGVVAYPSTPAADLFRTIEGQDASEGVDLEAFKRQKIQTQYGFAFLAFLAAALVGGHLYAVSRFDFAFDDNGFTFRETAHKYQEIASVDRRRWKSKGILVLILTNGARITLDAWHHLGVKDFAAKLPDPT